MDVGDRVSMARGHILRASGYAREISPTLRNKLNQCHAEVSGGPGLRSSVVARLIDAYAYISAMQGIELDEARECRYEIRGAIQALTV